MSKENYRRLGDYIREVDVRNRDLVATNVLLPPFSCGLWPVTAFSTIRMEVSALPTTPLWLLR